MEKSNQWELEGKCSICRRKNYCSKPCTRNKRETKAFIKGLATYALDRATGGAYSEMVERTGRDFYI